MIPISFFLDAYAPSLGLEASRQLVDRVAQSQGFYAREEFSKDEALEVCTALRDEPGVIKIIAYTLSARVAIHRPE